MKRLGKMLVALAASACAMPYSMADVANVAGARDQHQVVAVAGAVQLEVARPQRTGEPSSMAASANGQPTGDRSESPGAAAQEPAGWVRLLCVLVIVAFMAWRKARWTAD